jgi:MraZ protein
MQKKSNEVSELSEVVFRGNFTHSVDDKGRVSFPSDFRRVLNDSGDQRIVITNNISDGSRCIDGYNLSAWVEFESKLRTKSRFDSRMQKLETFYLTRATECTLDSSGRIMLPPHLRQYAGIEKEVSFTYASHGFRIWDSRVWNLVFSSIESELMEDPSLFLNLDL